MALNITIIAIWPLLLYNKPLSCWPYYIKEFSDSRYLASGEGENLNAQQGDQ